MPEAEDEIIEEELPEEEKLEEDDDFEKNMEIEIKGSEPVEVKWANIMLEKYTKFQKTNSRPL